MKQRKPHPSSSDTIPQGHWHGAISTVGLLHPEITHLLEDFARFHHPDARAAFADKWISLAASRFESTWTVFYQLLKIIETEQLYARASALEGKQTFPSFQAYWEAKTGKSFEAWLELEETYTYCCMFKPAMIDALYATAHKAKRAHENQEGAQANSRVGPKHVHISDADTNNKDISIRLRDGHGTSRTYALRRLAKDRHDLHALCLAGELTANAAMVQAGFRKPRPSRKASLLTRIQRLWDKADTEERQAIAAWIRAQEALMTSRERPQRQLGLPYVQEDRSWTS